MVEGEVTGLLNMSLTLKVSDSRTIHKLNSPVKVIALVQEMASLTGVKRT